MRNPLEETPLYKIDRWYWGPVDRFRIRLASLILGKKLWRRWLVWFRGERPDRWNCGSPDCCQGSDPDCQNDECCGYPHEV